MTRQVAATDATFAVIERLRAFAEGRGRTLLELAIAALAAQPGVASVIAGATSPDQVRANAAASEWELSPEDVDVIARVTSLPT